MTNNDNKTTRWNQHMKDAVQAKTVVYKVGIQNKTEISLHSRYAAWRQTPQSSG